MFNIENSQKVNQNFKGDGVKYQLDKKHVEDLSLHSENHDPLQCKLDLTEKNHLQGQDMHLSKIIVKCKL